MAATWTGCTTPAVTHDGVLLFRIAGTSVDSTSISDAIGPVPVRGRLLRFDFAEVSGDAASYLPRISRLPTAPDNTIELIAQPSGAADVHFAIAQEIPYYAPEGRLYLHPAAASGVNNSVKAELLIAPGWGS